MSKRKHDWKCVAPEGGLYRWVCQNCGDRVPYPSSPDKFDYDCVASLAAEPCPEKEESR